MPRGWFSYNVTSGTGDKFNPVNYDPLNAAIDCENGNIPCAIYAYYSLPASPKPPHPDPFPSPGNIRQYLSNVPASSQAQPTGANKKYLYLIPG